MSAPVRPNEPGQAAGRSEDGNLADHGRLRAIIEQLTRERTELEQRAAKLDRALTDAQEASRLAVAQAQSMIADAATAQTELDRRVAPLERALHEAQQAAQLAIDHAQEMIADAARTHQQLRIAAEQRETECAALAEQLQADLATARATTTAANEKSREIDAERNKERERLRAAAEQLAQQRNELNAFAQATAAARDQERRDHERAVAALTEQLARLREHYESRLAPVPAQRPHPQAALGDPAALLEKESDREPSSADRHADREAAAEQPGFATTDLLLLEDEAAVPSTAARLRAGGVTVTSIPVLPNHTPQLPEHPPRAIAVNFTVPAVWSAVRTFYGSLSRPTQPIFAYALAPPAPQGFWFGLVHVVLLPTLDQRLSHVIGGLVPYPTRAVIICSDREVSSVLTRQLQRAQLSATVARDRAHLLETIKTSPPQLAIVHLGTSPVDGFRAVAGIRAVPALKTIPILFVLDQTAPPHEPSLLGAAARAILRPGNFQLDDLAGTLATAVEGLPHPPAA